MKLSMEKVLVLVLLALSIAAFVYASYKAFTHRYQESVFLYGVAFVVLAQVLFVYRLYRFPDEKVGKGKEEEAEARES
ncbi:MAG: hypothetical protein JSV43_07575 [Methanobacteriota archaeon]|nr:MAG: hypothetical protein JSV43_07575 [Euryarchaeota archaeon]